MTVQQEIDSPGGPPATGPPSDGDRPRGGCPPAAPSLRLFLQPPGPPGPRGGADPEGQPTPPRRREEPAEVRGGRGLRRQFSQERDGRGVRGGGGGSEDAGGAGGVEASDGASSSHGGGSAYSPSGGGSPTECGSSPGGPVEAGGGRSPLQHDAPPALEALEGGGGAVPRNDSLSSDPSEGPQLDPRKTHQRRGQRQRRMSVSSSDEEARSDCPSHERGKYAVLMFVTTNQPKPSFESLGNVEQEIGTITVLLSVLV